MSITDELRKAADDIASTAVPCGASPDYIGVRRKIDAIADRIDAEHEAMLADARKTVYQGYVELPKDADGEYIHIGDVMEWPTTGETFEVVGIGDGTLFYVEDGSECADWTGASTKRHHHAPTVEDVLREFANEVYADADNEIRDRDFLCAKYAKRLTLAEGKDA